jgi:hypothetical protein
MCVCECERSGIRSLRSTDPTTNPSMPRRSHAQPSMKRIKGLETNEKYLMRLNRLRQLCLDQAEYYSENKSDLARRFGCTKADIKFTYVDEFKRIHKSLAKLDDKFDKVKKWLGEDLRYDEYFLEKEGEYEWLSTAMHADIMARKMPGPYLEENKRKRE